jgi:four helix bundle protein
MGQVNSYRDLLVWEQAIDLATSVYKCTKFWPREELYGLTQQARRAAVSVPANIAEGNGRELRGSYINFLRISQGSLKELETHLIIAHRAGVADEGDVKELLERCESVGKLLRLLIRKLGEAQSAN